MKTEMIAGLAVAVMLTVSGCTVIRELPHEEFKAEQEKAESFQLGQKLLTAFLRNDAAGFVGLLPRETREKFSEKHFIASRKSLVESTGEPISFRYVTALELPMFTPHIWKIRFQRVDRSGKHKYTSEILFRVITARVDGRTVITAFQFL